LPVDPTIKLRFLMRKQMEEACADSAKAGDA
jgi:hypothetical protein